MTLIRRMRWMVLPWIVWMIWGAAPGAAIGQSLGLNDPYDRDEAIYRVGQSWAYWWEVNRGRYLTAAEKRTGSTRLDAEAQALRRNAAASLTEAAGGDDPALAAEACIALGRIGGAQALRTLEPLTKRNQPTAVRQSAWLGIGTLNSSDAAEALARAGNLDPPVSTAWLAAVALIDQPPPPLLDVVSDYFVSSAAGPTQYMAARTLRVHSPPGNRQMMRNVLESTVDPVLFDQAVLGLGAANNPQDIDLFTELVLGHSAAQRLPIFQYFLKRRDALHEQWVRSRRDLWERDRLGLYLASPGAPRQWASAAMALGGFTRLRPDRLSEPRYALARTFSRIGPRQDAWESAAVVALGRIGGSEDVDDLRRALNARNVDGLRRHPRLQRIVPTRGFAAIALGLYTRRGEVGANRVGEAAARSRRSEGREISQLLARHLSNPSDPRDLRAACALALGLTGRTDNIQRLREASERSDQDDPLPRSYTILALSMLGDRRAAIAARNLLGVSIPAEDFEAHARRSLGSIHRERTDLSEFSASARYEKTLARRAAILALGVVGDPKFAGSLRSAWGRGRYISIEAARALGRCGVYDVAEPLIRFIREGGSQAAAPLAAASLGELFDRSRPSRLTRLVMGNKYVGARSAPWRPGYAPAQTEAGLGDLRGLGNPYLYRFMLPTHAGFDYEIRDTNNLADLLPRSISGAPFRRRSFPRSGSTVDR